MYNLDKPAKIYQQFKHGIQLAALAELLSDNEINIAPPGGTLLLRRLHGNLEFLRTI